jgi:hypothetical protein
LEETSDTNVEAFAGLEIRLLYLKWHPILFFFCQKLHPRCFQNWPLQSTRCWLVSIVTYSLLFNNYKHFWMKPVWHKCEGICPDRDSNNVLGITSKSIFL